MHQMFTVCQLVSLESFVAMHVCQLRSVSFVFTGHNLNLWGQQLANRRENHQRPETLNLSC